MNAEVELARDMGAFFSDPLGFVKYAFPWGEGELAAHDGPDEWQASLLADLGKGVVSASEAVRFATVSGHGIGKSALVAWIILWAMSTRPHLAGVVTANTGAQLSDKTWRELSVWHKRAIHRHWFKWTATKFYQVGHPETWFVSAIPWSKERPEAFAGLHAEHVLMIFDEASAIEDVIWDTAEGAMTTPGAVWCVFGNPTRNSGKFHGCFHRMRHRWNTRQVDSRTARMANRAQLDQWVADYGEDSDFVRVRVRGVFPRAGSCQLIPSDLVEEAAKRVLRVDMYQHAPKILGVDVARFGDDQSTFIRRQGLQAFGLRKFRGLDLMTYAGIVAQEIQEFGPDAVFVDQTGLGAGVVDRLRQLHCGNIIGVDFGSAAISPQLYANKRAEMWSLLLEWLKSGGALPPDQELISDLVAPEYGFTGDKGQIALEKKSDMKKRGLPSPDSGDALALTFAAPVYPLGGNDLPRYAVQVSNLYA
ncbi:terminase [Desulfovibrio sp. OttesenSCG-928-A18]|nr:terminase [Desulfovibrio sp. OttesenSCG-928-A18]